VNFIHFHVELKNSTEAEQFLNSTKKNRLHLVKQSAEGNIFKLTHAWYAIKSYLNLGNKS